MLGITSKCTISEHARDYEILHRTDATVENSSNVSFGEFSSQWHKNLKIGSADLKHIIKNWS